MTDNQGPASGAPPPPSGKPRRRPAPMIDLEATEIESKPVGEAAEKPTGEQAAAEQTTTAPDTPAPQPAYASEAAAPEQPAQQPPPEPPHADAASDEPPKPPPRKTSIAWLPPGIPWPLIGAGAVGGAVVLVVLLLANLVPGRDPGASPLDARLARLEQQLRELAGRPGPATVDRRTIDDLAGRLARVEAALANPRPAAMDPAFANRLATLEGEVKAMAETVSIIGRRGDDIAVTAREARQRADATAAALAELTQKVTRLGAPAVERRELDALVSRVDAIERGEKAVEAELARRSADGSDRPLRLAVVAATLKGAVERGDPFAAELTSAKSLAADPKVLAPLEPFAASGVPTAAALARELSALAPALYQAAGTPAREGGFLDRLQASAEKLVRIRPVEEIAGSDPAAIISRVEVRAAQADLAGALAELAALPAAARAPAEPWIKKAQARAAAVDASRRFAADALAALGK